MLSKNSLKNSNVDYEEIEDILIEVDKYREYLNFSNVEKHKKPISGSKEDLLKSNENSKNFQQSNLFYVLDIETEKLSKNSNNQPKTKTFLDFKKYLNQNSFHINLHEIKTKIIEDIIAKVDDT